MYTLTGDKHHNPASCGSVSTQHTNTPSAVINAALRAVSRSAACAVHAMRCSSSVPCAPSYKTVHRSHRFSLV